MLALFAHLRLNAAVILGNSLGGVNAYQFAARYPERVRALVIEDMGCEIAGDLSFVLDWEGIFESRQDLEARLGPRMSSYLSDSVRHTAKGWTLAFEPRDMIASKAASTATIGRSGWRPTARHY